MPTHDRSAAISADEARHRSGMRAFPEPAGRAGLGDRVGLEPELFPVQRDRAGRPAGRLLLSRPDGVGVLEVVDELATGDDRIGARTGEPLAAVEYPVEGGGRLTFEPGAQVEHSTAVYPSVATAIGDVEDVLGRLRRAFRRHGVELAAIGMDIWHDVETVPQQLRAGRYTAQAAYYRQRGHWGAVMMRHTASLQVNLDLGPAGVWQERWLLANLIGPMMTASFASSPSAGSVCTRARAWQELDPTRSGYPRLLVEAASDDPREHWGQAALEADVMLYRLDDGRYEPGCPGCSFGQWAAEGHPRWGWPTAADLDYHLTTMFFEVRPRGFLELRAGEALPGPWRPVPVALTAALLYDHAARESALGLLAGRRQQLSELWRRAAADGVHDPELQRLACELWGIALAGARRLPKGFVGDKALAACETFLERFTGQGRVPGDELAELDTADPARALAWASS
jgi:glutamate--cysteine ligase